MPRAKIDKPALISTADQVVSHQGKVREKPASAEEARHFLRTASEAPSETVSAVAATNTSTGKSASGVDAVRIHMRPIPEELIEKLIEKGQIFYCAGSIQLEDPLVEPYVEHMEGAIDSVIGLPKELTIRLLGEVG